jgi:FkbM family methyltransferase
MSTNDVIFQACLSDTPEQEVTFHIADNRGMSSSMFQFKHHKEKYPFINMTNDIILKTDTLDDLMEKNKIPHNFYNIMIMDLQGAELKTLMGAKKVISSINAIVSEVSEIELYENAPLENDIDTYLSNYKFKRVLESYTEYGWGEALYIKEQ